MTVRVVKVVRETKDAVSLVLEPSGSEPGRVDYRPGQFLTIRIPTDGPEGTARCYSLCSSPVHDQELKVTVKRTVGGYGSNWICDQVLEGDELEVLRPSGAFTPRSLDNDLLLVAGGSGITPVMSILKSVLMGGSGSVTLVYANRDEHSIIFRDELVSLEARYSSRLKVVHWIESEQGIPSAEGLSDLLAPYVDREAFVCGPAPFMDLTVEVLTALGVASNRVQVERFTSLTGDPFATNVVHLDEDGPSASVEVSLDGNVTTIDWPTSNKLLDVLLDAGLDAPFSCREGACSACACVLLEGEVDLEHNEILDDQDLDEGIILACQARPLTERLAVTYDY